MKDDRGIIVNTPGEFFPRLLCALFWHKWRPTPEVMSQSADGSWYTCFCCKRCGSTGQLP